MKVSRYFFLELCQPLSQRGRATDHNKFLTERFIADF
jgi:hypothetical protein